MPSHPDVLTICDHLRSPCFAPNELAKAEVQIPNDALDSAEDKQDPMYQQRKQSAYTNIQQQAALLSLIEDPERRVLILIGSPRVRWSLFVVLLYRSPSWRAISDLLVRA